MLNLVISLEVEAATEAAKYERSSERTTYRNGTRTRVLSTEQDKSIYTFQSCEEESADIQPTEKVRLIKQNNQIIEDIEVLADKKKFFIDDATVLIEENDVIERVLPTGGIEQYFVTDQGIL